MSLTAPRLSATELSQRILEMATTGVYRESIFEAFQPFATKRAVRTAIAQAKQFGLYSVRGLRDPELGTYYQVDPDRYASFQSMLRAAVSVDAEEDLAARIVLSTRVIRSMVAIAGANAIALLMVGAGCLLTGHLHSGQLAWASAASFGLLWVIQRQLARSLL